MKNTLITLALFALLASIPMSTFGQKLKDKQIKFHYVDLPSETLPADFLTYSVKVYGGNAGSSAGSLAQSIKMSAFKRLEPSEGKQGHLRITVNTGYTRSGRAERKTETKTTKDKEGKETTTKYYWYSVPYSTTTSYSIVGPKGKIFAEGRYPVNKTLNTTKYTNASTGYNARTENIAKLRNNFVNEARNDVMSRARTATSNGFDFAQRYQMEQFYFITKHDQEDAYVKAFDVAKEVFENPDNRCKSSTEIRQELEAPIAFWERESEKKPNGDKKLQRLYQAANYNLAVVNFYLDDFDATNKYAINVINEEGKDGRSERLMKRISDRKEGMKLHGLESSRYCRDVSNAMGPGEVSALEEEKEEIKAENNTTAGSIVFDGKSIEGSFAQEKDVENMVFGADGNTKFVVEENNELKDYHLDDEKISTFTMGERKFVKKQFATCAKGKSETKMCIMEEVYSSERINLYEYFPSTGALSDEKSEFAFQRGAEDTPVSLQDTQFLLWKKGLAKYFEDCSDLNAMCLEGGIEMNRDDLIKASRIYSELCTQ